MNNSSSSKFVPEHAEEDSQGIEVVIEVRGDRKAKHLVVVRQALGIKNGRLVLAGPKKEERVQTFEWVASKLCQAG